MYVYLLMYGSLKGNVNPIIRIRTVTLLLNNELYGMRMEALVTYLQF
jgi:hypothetical protein